MARIDQFPQMYVGLVYVGKLINQEKTFLEEFVEDECEIIVINMMEYGSIKKEGEKINND